MPLNNTHRFPWPCILGYISLQPWSTGQQEYSSRAKRPCWQVCLRDDRRTDHQPLRSHQSRQTGLYPKADAASQVMLSHFRYLFRLLYRSPHADTVGELPKNDKRSDVESVGARLWTLTKYPGHRERGQNACRGRFIVPTADLSAPANPIACP